MSVQKRTLHFNVDVWEDPKERYFNTAAIVLNNKKYCPYCGKELKLYTEWDHYDEIHYYNCDCEDANKEHDLEIMLDNIKRQLPIHKYKLKTVIQPIK